MLALPVILLERFQELLFAVLKAADRLPFFQGDVHVGSSTRRVEENH